MNASFPIPPNLFPTILTQVNKKDRSSFGSILLTCSQAKNADDIQKVYFLLIQVLPDFNEEELRIFSENHLPFLLQNLTPLLQQDIAIQLAKWYFAHPNDSLEGLFQSSLQAMHYFAKAIQIATFEKSSALKDIHGFSTEIFIRLIEQLLIKNDTLKKRLESFRKSMKGDIHARETFAKHIIQIEHLESFCFSEKDHSMRQILYSQTTAVLALVTVDRKEEYASCFEDALKGLAKPFSLPDHYPTEKYSKGISLFRDTFATFNTMKAQTPEIVRDFQKGVTKAFKTFFQSLLDDAFAILGPPPSTYQLLKYEPPCTYDVRAMGSIGREEICPYSDLEFMILIQDKKGFAYFKTLVHILEIQIASLGETSTTHPVFTCIHTKNPSGLHIDSSPTLNGSLIQTPDAMARIQYNSVEDPQTIENTALKTISLSQTDSSLYKDYQIALEEPLKACREERAITFFAFRLQNYKKHWKQPFNPKEDIINIKKVYVEVLNHLLSDLAFFYGIAATNTLDIIDELVALEIFTEESGLLLKESVAAIYAIRLRLHTLYKEQKEEGSCMPHPQCKQLLPFEIHALEKCYWLILRPLYDCLQTIIIPTKPMTRTTPTEFKISFKKIDLIQISFKQNLSCKTVPKPFIIQIATHLSLTNASPETHLNYFKPLSDLPFEYPRQIYLETLEKNRATRTFNRLIYIPNLSGLRPIFLKDYERLQQGLNAITDPFDTKIPGKPVVFITAPHFVEPRYLKPSLIEKIMDGENIKSEYIHSAHRVCSLSYEGYEFHLKQEPHEPLMEYAIHNLSSRIGGKLTPTSELVWFEVYSNGKKKIYPVLVSETILGVNLKESQKGPFHMAQYTWILLLAILTRPGDGRFSNYIVGNLGKIYCIDNDISFAEPITKEYGMKEVHFCSALFCLTRINTPLHVETLREFASLNGDAIFNAWIEDIIAKEQKYRALFPKEEILLREGALATLNLQFWRLQNRIALSLQQGIVMTVGDLLKELISLREENIGNYVFKAYDNKETTPEKRLQKAIDRKQEQSMTSVQSHQICLGKIPTLHEIKTSKRFSPSNAKQEFFFTLLQKNTNHASLKESQGKIVIEANFKDLQQEIKRQRLVLKALSEQFKMMKKKPDSIIFNHCTILTSDLLVVFLHADLESLDLRYCENIDNKTVTIIEKRCPKLKKLLLAGCKRITDISNFPFDPMLKFPYLVECDVSHCKDLHTLKIEVRSLQNLNAKNNPLLKEVELIHMEAEIDFTNSPQVHYAHINIAETTLHNGFGKQAWVKHFGEIGLVPPLPSNILEILNNPCPFWANKQVKETHILVLIPKTVDGKPFTLNRLHVLMQHSKPKKLEGITYYPTCKHMETEVNSSYWVLMTQHAIPGVRDIQSLKILSQDYEIPTLLEAATCMLSGYFYTGNRFSIRQPIYISKNKCPNHEGKPERLYDSRLNEYMSDPDDEFEFFHDFSKAIRGAPDKRFSQAVYSPWWNQYLGIPIPSQHIPLSSDSTDSDNEITYPSIFLNFWSKESDIKDHEYCNDFSNYIICQEKNSWYEEGQAAIGHPSIEKLKIVVVKKGSPYNIACLRRLIS